MICVGYNNKSCRDCLDSNNQDSKDVKRYLLKIKQLEILIDFLNIFQFTVVCPIMIFQFLSLFSNLDLVYLFINWCFCCWNNTPAYFRLYHKHPLGSFWRWLCWKLVPFLFRFICFYFLYLSWISFNRPIPP